MTTDHSPIVRRPDGTTQPFEPERITRRLFAATVAVGKADAFLARELTEGVVHFLTAEGEPLTTEAIAEMTSKVVRELGRPDIARAYAARQAGPAVADPLSAIYPPDLVSAHREGLIHIHDEELRPTLAGGVVELPRGRIVSALREAERWIGETIAVDGPEWDLAAEAGSVDELADTWAAELEAAVRVAVIVNLNSATPPRRAGGGSGPLFDSPSADPERRRGIALALASRLGHRVQWHVETPGEAPAKVVSVIIDRPRHPVELGPGLDRDGPPTLLRVGVNLARLAELIGTPPVDAEKLLTKAASLARFAKTAAHAKQDWLRRHGPPSVREAFRLDRARWVMVPEGLEALATDQSSADMARQLAKTLLHAAEADRPRAMGVRLV